MARKSPWQEFAENFQGVYGTFKQIGQDVETGRIMSDKFTSEGGLGAGLKGDALEEARYKALGDIYTKYGNAKEGLAMRQGLANLEEKRRSNDLSERIFENQVRLQGILAENEKKANIGLTTARTGNVNASTKEILDTLPLDMGILQNTKKTGDQAIAFTDATQPGLITKTNAESQAGVSKALSDQKVTDNQYSWLSQTAQNEAAFTEANSQIDLDGLKYLAESERLSSLAKEYQLAGATADRNTFQIAAMEEYRTDIQSGKFGEGDDFDQGAATNAFLQLTAAFEGQPAATALYNQYVKDGNEAELGKILNKGMILGAKVKNALTGPDGISGVQVLFDEENGDDFGMRFGQVELADGTIGVGLIETNEETGEDMRAIAAAANEVELGAMLETMTGPTGMIGLAERLYQRDKRALDTKKTNADITNLEQRTETSSAQADALMSSIGLDTAKVKKINADIEKINNDVKNADTTKSVQIKEEGLQRFLSGDTYGYMLESNPQGAANLLGSFKYNTGMLSPALYEAGISLQQYLNMPDADKAQFEN